MGRFSKCKLNLCLFNDIPPREPRLQASSSPIPRLRIDSVEASQLLSPLQPLFQPSRYLSV